MLSTLAVAWIAGAGGGRLPRRLDVTNKTFCGFIKHFAEMCSQVLPRVSEEGGGEAGGGKGSLGGLMSLRKLDQGLTALTVPSADGSNLPHADALDLEDGLAEPSGAASPGRGGEGGHRYHMPP